MGIFFLRLQLQFFFLGKVASGRNPAAEREAREEGGPYRHGPGLCGGKGTRAYILAQYVLRIAAWAPAFKQYWAAAHATASVFPIFFRSADSPLQLQQTPLGPCVVQAQNFFHWNLTHLKY